MLKNPEIERLENQIAADNLMINSYVKKNKELKSMYTELEMEALALQSRVDELEKEHHITEAKMKRYSELLTNLEYLRERCKEYADEVAIKSNTVYKSSIKVSELEQKLYKLARQQPKEVDVINKHGEKHCVNCGESLVVSFDYCPGCGGKLKWQAITQH